MLTIVPIVYKLLRTKNSVDKMLNEDVKIVTEFHVPGVTVFLETTNWQTATSYLQCVI